MRLHVLFLAILLLSTMVFAMANEVTEASQAVVSSANYNSPASHIFNDKDALTRAISGKPSVVCFFNANCSKCKAFEQDWLNTARKTTGVQFVAMDANKNPLIPAGFEFRYFPSVWYIDAKGNKWRYTDSLNEFSLTEFVKNALKTPTFSLLEQFEKFDAPLSSEQMADQCIYKSAAEHKSFMETAATTEVDLEAEQEMEMDEEADEEVDEEVDEEAEEEAEEATEEQPAFMEVDEELETEA